MEPQGVPGWGAESRFCPPDCRGWGWKVPRAGGHILLPHRPGAGWEHEEQRDPPGLNPRVQLFSCIFQVLLQHTEQPEKVRDKGLWGVNAEGMETGAPHTPQQPGMLPPLPPSSATASAAIIQLQPRSAVQLWSCLEHPGAPWSTLEQARDSLPSALPNLGTVPTPKSSLRPQTPLR